MSTHPLSHGTQHPSQGELLKLVLSRIVVVIVVLFGMFFLPAGTFNYWEAWGYLAILLIPMSFALVYLYRYDPKLLERRMRLREKEASQKWILEIGLVYFFFTFLFPGFDKRFEWSVVPVAVVLVADAVVLLSYATVLYVFKQNSYASRIVEVEEGQKVITTGLYGIVRHPMYLAVIFMYSFTPLALGSYWGIIPALFIIPLLIVRIQREEMLLEKELKGYTEYQQQTKYRLIPWVW